MVDAEHDILTWTSFDRDTPNKDVSPPTQPTSTEPISSQQEDVHNNNPSFGSSKPLAEPQPASAKPDESKTNIEFWNKGRNLINFPSPTPHGHDEGYFDEKGPKKNPISSLWEKLHGESEEHEEYPTAINPKYKPEEQGEPLWTKYLKPKDRETMTLRVFGQAWLRWLPFIGEKVDKIDHCRKEIARLNLEIEQDQKEPEKYPLMNSAFIQFNHQIAAHMACQSVSHHTPNQMDPRAIEISPNDVIWDNMHIKWWERYARTFGILVLIVALVFGWAIPVGFTAFLNNIDQLAQQYQWLKFLANIPESVKSILQGILPPVLLAILLAVLPLLLRFLARIQGLTSHMAVELMVQHYYFFFLFVQIFLVVTMASAITHILPKLAEGVQNIPGILADNLPKASNYFFSYLLLQALSVSASTLVQIVQLAFWFILGPILDSTARAKWSRQVQLPELQWGTFFPTYTNLAVIGKFWSSAYSSHVPIKIRGLGLISPVIAELTSINRYHLFRDFTADYGFQHHYVRFILVCVPLQHPLCHKIPQRYRWITVPCGNQPAFYRPILHGALSSGFVLHRCSNQ